MRTFVSSRVTLAYKFIFVPVWCIGAVGMGIFVALHFSDVKGVLLGVGMVLVVLVWVWLMIRKLRTISFDDSYLYVINFQREVKFDLRRIRAVNVPTIRIDPFFEVEIETADLQIKRIEFMPRFMEQIDFWVHGSLSGTALFLQRKARDARAQHQVNSP